MDERYPREWKKVEGFNFGEIIYEKKYFDNGGVARITINRPEKLNALTNFGFNEIVEALDDANIDDSVGVVVITGAGDKAFCSGGDVQWEEEGGLRRQFMFSNPPNEFIKLCLKPVIAAVKGYAIGGGNHLAYWCDLTIAADNAIFGQAGPRVGSPAAGNFVRYLTKVIGMKRAAEMWFLCRRYNAQQALEMGLVNAVVPVDKLDEEVDKWCQELLALSPTCLRLLKATFAAEAEYLGGPSRTFVMKYAPDYFRTEESREGPQSFLEKRKPNFGKFRMKQNKD